MLDNLAIKTSLNWLAVCLGDKYTVLKTSYKAAHETPRAAFAIQPLAGSSTRADSLHAL
jgi:hypothetical protein